MIIILLITLFGQVAFPQASMQGVREGIGLCAKVIIPSLFPFMVCSNLLIKSKLIRVLNRYLGKFGTAFYVFTVGSLSGYPMGAKCAADLCTRGICSKKEAEWLLAFCNNCSSLYIIGAVGIGLMGSYRVGVILYISHILSSLILSVLFVAKGNDKVRNRTQTEPVAEKLDIAESILDSLKQLAKVCGLVLFFSSLTAILGETLLKELPIYIKGGLFGLLEITKGIALISSKPTSAGLIITSALISFGGVCVILQTASVVAKAGLSIVKYTTAKLAGAMLSAAITLIMLNLPIGAATVSTVTTASSSGIVNAFVYSGSLLGFSTLIIPAFLLVSRRLSSKSKQFYNE